ncbi:MAG TPA: helix-turn-helix domain-containing protein [Opitutaceae bacterium]|nr:helix-turn-helix domain-containing protein [Opitutaceae bacterium]
MWREFIEFAEKRQEPFSAICARFGISRKTGYKWLNRFRTRGAEGLVEQSRRPKTSPRKTPDSVEEQILGLRAENPDWSASRICQALQARGVSPLPATSTVDLILRRRRSSAQAFPLGQGPTDAASLEPNFRWIVRCKEPARLPDGDVVVTVWVEDDVTHFVVACWALPAARREAALKDELESLFRRQGLPWRLLLPFPRVHTPLTVWIMTLGVAVDFAEQPEEASDEQRRQLAQRMAHLPAYQRAHVERLRGAEESTPILLGRGVTRKTVSEQLELWRERHNFGQTRENWPTRSPISLYRPSGRPCPDLYQPFTYMPGAEIRLISEKGIFTLQRRLVHVGRAFAGKTVEVRSLPAEDSYLVLFGPHVLGKVDLQAALPDETTSLPLEPV